MDQMDEKDQDEYSKFERYFRRASALIFWVYLLTKVFVFDFDNFLISRFLPQYEWLLNFKFIFLLAFIAIVWMFTPKNWVYFWIFYVIISPLYLFLYRVPAHFLKSKNWIGAFALIGLALSFFKRLKFNFISTALTLLMFLIIANAKEPFLIYPAIIFLGGNLILILVRAVYFSFKPSMLFAVQSEALVKIWSVMKNPCSLEDELKTLEFENFSEQQKAKWVMNLQFAMIVNRICYFVSSKLRDFQKSRVNIIYYVINFLILVLAAICIFAFGNYGLYRIDQTSFTGQLRRPS